MDFKKIKDEIMNTKNIPEGCGIFVITKTNMLRASNMNIASDLQFAYEFIDSIQLPFPAVLEMLVDFYNQNHSTMDKSEIDLMKKAIKKNGLN